MPSWGQLLLELSPKIDNNGQTINGLDYDQLRHKYIKELFELTNRNVICYYSGWLTPGKQDNLDINDRDMTGFMNCIQGLDCSLGLDLILHTPGGYPTATEGLVKYLRSKFENIRAIIPQMSMSAGTMLACSADEILMGKHSCLGPIDPQYGSVPAYNIKKEFEKAKEDLIKNPNAAPYWQLMLGKYPPAFYNTVNDAIQLSSQLTTEWLTSYMLSNKPKKKVIASKIVSKLNANNKSHSRHFNAEFCKSLGMNVNMLEENQALQEAVLSVHHSFIITLDQTRASKIIENQNETRYIVNCR